MGSTAELPFFQYEGHEIVTVLDPPHLLKCFRDKFLKHDIICPRDFCTGLGALGESIAKWQHIEDFYKLDTSNPNFVFAPALTSRHLNPNEKDKMDLKLAEQVLSHAVAAGIHAKVASNYLPTAALTTATVIEKVHRLFEYFNGDSPSRTPKGDHHKTLEDMKYFFSNTKFEGARTELSVQNGWVRTIIAFQRLFCVLKKRHIKSLAVQRLNLDPLEKLLRLHMRILRIKR